jgi:hypothetical protein
MKTLILLIPLLPFLGFLINGLGRKYFSKGLLALSDSGVRCWASFIISHHGVLRIDELSGKHSSPKNAKILADPVVKYFRLH